MKKLHSLLSLILLFVATVSAQVNPGQVIPTDTKLTKGTLANGLTYYIKENKKPEKKVELRLVVKVGSIVEDDDQQGLAHMAEHMAFNGTKNFKKNEIVSFLQDIGVGFGSDLNAYTSFDETVYILPIPTDKSDNLEKGFQILEDWAHQVTYLDEDINSERAIILEESRLGKSGEERMFKKVYPEYFKGSKYAKRLPIGLDSIIKNFNPDDIRRFYADWYRPDLMAVVVVGDVSKEEAIKMINKHFAGLKNPATPRTREYASVPAFTENKAMVVTDKEATNVEFSINYPAFLEKKSGTLGEFRSSLLKSLYTAMLGVRLRELTQKENPPFVYAGAEFSSNAKNYNSFSVQGSTGTGDVKKGIEAAVEELEKVKRFGFTEPELERAKKNISSMYENAYNNRDKTESGAFAEEYIRNFTDNESIPGISAEFDLVKSFLPSITVAEVNAVTDIFKNEKNKFSFVMGPEASNSINLPTGAEVVSMIASKENDKSIKGYEEKVIATALLTNMPQAGTVTSAKKNALLGTTEIVLSNGLKVSLKKTDFKNDQILFSASRYGGLTTYPLSDKYSAENTVTMISNMGIGSFSPTDLRKALAGKTVSLSPNISSYTSGFSGSSSIKDLETFFQMLYLYVKEPRKDTALFKSILQRAKGQVAMLGANPEISFIDTLTRVLYNDNPLAPTAVPKLSNFDMINLDRVMSIYKERLGDLGGMHISIVGSFDETEIIALLQKYVAGFPAKTKAAYVDNKVKPFDGEKNFQYKKGKEDKSLIIGSLSGEIPYSEALDLKLTALSDAMNILITEEMREKIQGIYGGGTNVNFSKIPYGHYQFILQLPCGPAKVDTLIAAFHNELNAIATDGINVSYVDKVKKAWVEKYREDIKSNEYWLSALQQISTSDLTIDRFLNAEKYYNQLTSSDIKQAALIIKQSKGKMIAVQMPEGK